LYRRDQALFSKPRWFYWLAKDFVEKDFQTTSEPDARDVAKIRNHLEHRYLKVHERDPIFLSEAPDIYPDRLAFSVDRHELEAKSLRVLKLARAAMIHLCLSIHREEAIRSNKESGFAMPMVLPPWNNSRKTRLRRGSRPSGKGN
jgi:LA2681-like HEPN